MFLCPLPPFFGQKSPPKSVNRHKARQSATKRESGQKCVNQETLSHFHTFTLSHFHTFTLSHTSTLPHFHTSTLPHTSTLSHFYTFTLSHTSTHPNFQTHPHFHTFTIYKYLCDAPHNSSLEWTLFSSTEVLVPLPPPWLCLFSTPERELCV